MKYRPISVHDDEKEFAEKLRVYGYPLESFRQCISFILIINKQFDRDKEKKINREIQKLENLKKRITSTLREIYAEIKAVKTDTIYIEALAGIDESTINKVFKTDDFFERIDAFIDEARMRKKAAKIKLPKKMRETTIDYVIGAVLSLVIRDSRGARWKDIYELLRWYRKERKDLEGQAAILPGTTKYRVGKLEEQSKYIKKKYTQYVTALREIYFPPSSQD